MSARTRSSPVRAGRDRAGGAVALSMLSTLFTVVAVTSVVFAVAGVAADATRIATLLGLVCAGTATVALLLAWASRRATRRAGAAAIADAVQARGLGPRLATGDLARRR